MLIFGFVTMWSKGGLCSCRHCVPTMTKAERSARGAKVDLFRPLLITRENWVRKTFEVSLSKSESQWKTWKTERMYLPFHSRKRQEIKARGGRRKAATHVCPAGSASEVMFALQLDGNLPRLQDSVERPQS